MTSINPSVHLTVVSNDSDGISLTIFQTLLPYTAGEEPSIL